MRIIVNTWLFELLGKFIFPLKSKKNFWQDSQRAFLCFKALDLLPNQIEYGKPLEFTKSKATFYSFVSRTGIVVEKWNKTMY